MKLNDKEIIKIIKGLPKWEFSPIKLDDIIKVKKRKPKFIRYIAGLLLGAMFYTAIVGIGKVKASSIQKHVLEQEKQNLERIVDVMDGKTLLVNSLHEKDTKIKLNEIIDTTGLDMDINKSIILKQDIVEVNYPIDNFYVSSGYGWRKIDPEIYTAYKRSIGGDIIIGKKTFHHGVDLATRLYSEVKSPIDGSIKRIGYNKGLGYFVDIYAKDSLHEIMIRLAHLTFGKKKDEHMKWIKVKQSMSVSKGQVVGYVGLTGATTGPHVHEELWVKSKGWKRYDPLKGYGRHHLYALHKHKDRKRIYQSTLNTAKGIADFIRKQKSIKRYHL